MSVYLIPGGGTAETTGLPLYAPVLSGAAPGSPLEGQLWYDPVTHLLEFRTNTTTINLLAAGTTPGLPAVITAGGDATTLQGVTADGPNAGLLFKNQDNQFFDDQGRAWIAMALDAGTDYTVANFTVNAHLQVDSGMTLVSLPTVDPHVVGVVWNSSGVLHISTG